jgi:SAM-dependent methyltransferase
MLTTIRRIVPATTKDRLRPIQSVLSSAVYAGRSVECPVCGGTFRGFLGREDTQCPRCRTVQRHRLLMLYLRRETDIFSDTPKRLLHVAPEWYLQKYFRQIDSIEYLSGDIESPRAMVRLDITSLGFPDSSFDVILCSHVLEHVPDDRSAMRELFRVMKPGGWGILDAPTDMAREESFEDWTVTKPNDRARVFGQADHVRIYGRDYPDRLRDAGFHVEMDKYVITPHEVTRFRLNPTVDHIWMCRKPV